MGEVERWGRGEGNENNERFKRYWQHMLKEITHVSCSYNRVGLPWWLSGKESSCHAGDIGDASSIPGLERSPGGGNGR